MQLITIIFFLLCVYLVQGKAVLEKVYIQSDDCQTTTTTFRVRPITEEDEQLKIEAIANGLTDGTLPDGHYDNIAYKFYDRGFYAYFLYGVDVSQVKCYHIGSKAQASLGGLGKKPPSPV